MSSREKTEARVKKFFKKDGLVAKEIRIITDLIEKHGFSLSQQGHIIRWYAEIRVRMDEYKKIEKKFFREHTLPGSFSPSTFGMLLKNITDSLDKCLYKLHATKPAKRESGNSKEDRAAKRLRK